MFLIYISVIHGQKLWGIPKELAKFEWQQHDNEVVCTIEVEQHKMQIRLKKITFTAFFLY